MSGDYTKFTFKPKKDYSAVLKQQGRVDLDADFNELIEIIDRRWRSETIDIIGHCVVPSTTPDAFLITPTGVSPGAFNIGIGRMYVDGIEVECHGLPPDEYQADLGELRGTLPVPYSDQPYLPAPLPPVLTAAPNTTDLVYIDVWQREVTVLEDPGLREVALGGPDTTTRVQAAWQVRVLENVGQHACGDTIPAWDQLVAPSAGRLSTSAVPPPASDDPCIISPTGGYRGLENRLYRVEIHSIGPIGGGAPAKFKWSRNNATIASAVSAIPSTTQVTVSQVGRDQVLRFDIGNWIEITDDYREFQGLAGHMAQITAIDEANRVLAFAPAIPGAFNFDATNASRHTRVRRWDQSQNVDANGLLDVVAGPIDIEDGIRVTFTLDPVTGNFKLGDYWVFAARTADGSVEAVTDAPPRGILHHYCRLAIVTSPGKVIDCRTFWPPPFGEGKGESCDCTICVSADQHRTNFTIQAAVDLIRTTGGTICLGPGDFILQGPVQLDHAFAVRIRGQGAATRIIHLRGAAFIFSESTWCTLDYLTILCSTDATTEPAIRLRDSVGTTIERLMISAPRGSTGPLTGVLLEAGSLLQTKIRDNFFRAQVGVFAPARSPEVALVLDSFYCENNSMRCSNTGVQLAGSNYYRDTIIARNLIDGSTVAGIAVTGFASTELDLTGNTITPEKGDGIVVDTSARVSNNEIVSLGRLEGNADRGIRLVPDRLKLGLATVIVSGNRLQGLRGDGISIETGIGTGRIERNILTNIRGHGLVMVNGSEAYNLSVLGNELIDVATAESGDNGWEIAGIHLLSVAVGAVADNILRGIGANATDAGIIAGVRIDDCLDMRISDNSIVDLAPELNFSNLAAGVLVQGLFANVQIASNTIRRQLAATGDQGNWQAIRISSQDTLDRRFAGFTDLSAIQRVNVIDRFAAASARNAQEVGIHGNTLQGYGKIHLIEVFITGTCRFCDNQCSVERQQIAVLLTATSIIATANRIDCQPGQAGALILNVPNKDKDFTALGNITGGEIRVNNGSLVSPWKELNRMP